MPPTRQSRLRQPKKKKAKLAADKAVKAKAAEEKKAKLAADKAAKAKAAEEKKAKLAADKAVKAKAAEEKKAKLAADKAAKAKAAEEKRAKAAADRAAKLTSPKRSARRKSPTDTSPEPLTLESIKEQIREAYLRETHGAVKERVLLSDLRPKVGVQSEDFDQALLAMQQQGKVVLMGLDNPMERTPDVEAAAIHIAGRPRYLVYFQG